MIKWIAVDERKPPSSERVLMWLKEGQKGNGELAVGMFVYYDGEDEGGWWTWGGPNANVYFEEEPTHWAFISFDDPQGIQIADKGA